MTRARGVLLAVPPLALAGACKAPETQFYLVVPPLDGGRVRHVHRLACVNYVEFSVPSADRVHQPLRQGQRRARDSVRRHQAGGRPRAVQAVARPVAADSPAQGRRVFPAVKAAMVRRTARRSPIFRGSTVAEGRIGDYNGRHLDLTINMIAPCGPPEQFFFPPEGGTCAEICGAQANVICDGVAEGCLCPGTL